MNPVYWLLIWLAGTALACLTVAFIFFRLGWDHAEQEADRLRRHTHREGDPAPGVLIELPRAGVLSAFPEPEPTRPAPTIWDTGAHITPWVFAGGWDEGPVTVEQPAVPGVDTPSDFTRAQAREVDELLAKYAAETNEFIFSMRDVG